MCSIEFRARWLFLTEKATYHRAFGVQQLENSYKPRCGRDRKRRKARLGAILLGLRRFRHRERRPCSNRSPVRSPILVLTEGNTLFVALCLTGNRCSIEVRWGSSGIAADRKCGSKWILPGETIIWNLKADDQADS